MARHFATIDDYIGSFPADVQIILERVRRTIRKAAPAAEETISYQMPTFTLDGGARIYVAAWKNHISLYPLPAGDEAFERALAPYRAAKSTARFPLREPIPCDLIERLVVLHRRQSLDGARRSR